MCPIGPHTHTLVYPPTVTYPIGPHTHTLAYPIGVAGILPIPEQMLDAAKKVSPLGSVIPTELTQQFLLLLLLSQHLAELSKPTLAAAVLQEGLEQLRTQHLVQILQQRLQFYVHCGPPRPKNAHQVLADFQYELELGSLDLARLQFLSRLLAAKLNCVCISLVLHSHRATFFTHGMGSPLSHTQTPWLPGYRPLPEHFGCHGFNFGGQPQTSLPQVTSYHFPLSEVLQLQEWYHCTQLVGSVLLDFSSS